MVWKSRFNRRVGNKNNEKSIIREDMMKSLDQISNVDNSIDRDRDRENNVKGNFFYFDE